MVETDELRGGSLVLVSFDPVARTLRFGVAVRISSECGRAWFLHAEATFPPDRHGGILPGVSPLRGVPVGTLGPSGL
jgi:hypothetical protein